MSILEYLDRWYLSRSCIDSAMMVNLALKYSDTVTVGKPVNMVIFFSSDKDFIPNEISQPVDETNKSCLVVISLNMNVKIPTGFVFYNERGERIYRGNKWMPKGEEIGK